MSLRLRQVALVAAHLEPVVAELRALFGFEIAYRDPGVASFGLENAVLPVGSQFVEVVAPITDATAGGRYLERRGGDGGYMVILQCDDHGPVKRRIDALGIRKVVEHDSPEYRLMQLHPRDTGGSFLEIDVQVGGEAPDGPWEPAGPDWKRAVRTERVSAVAAVEIQGPDPSTLAARWGQILDRPVRPGDGGDPTLALDDATIRFVEDRDGRGEGLGGADLVATDAPAVLADAERAGRRISGDAVAVGGMRIRLVART